MSDAFEFIRKQQEMFAKLNIPKLNEHAQMVSKLSRSPFAEHARMMDRLTPSYVKSIQRLGVLDPGFARTLQFQKQFKKIGAIPLLAEYANVIKTIGATQDFSSAVISSLKFREYDFNELFQEDDQEEEVVLSETSRIQSIISDVYANNNILYTLDPRDFEIMVAELLFSHGFKVDLTKQTRDNGYDILAIKDMGAHSPLKYLVECKRFAEERKVGVQLIRSFKEVIQVEQANKGIIVTTSYFTRGAEKKRIKEVPYLLDFRDKTGLMEWIHTYWKEKLRR